MTTLNQYATLAEADTYLETVLNTEVWDLSTDVLRTKALKQATRMIQSLNLPDFVDPVDPTIIAATTEIAMKLLDGYDPELELAAASIQSLSFDGLQQSNKVREETNLHILAGIPSAYAFNLLRAFMPQPNTVKLNRAD